MSPSEKCLRCGRPAEGCHKYPAEGWPDTAKAYMRAVGWPYLHSCDAGIKRDLCGDGTEDGKGGGLWCWDRVIRHPEYQEPVEPVETPEGEEVAA